MYEVKSDVLPKTVEYLKGVALVNALVTKTEGEDGVLYTYTQSKLPESSTKEQIEHEIIRMYENRIKSISSKCSNSLRAKLLGVAVDFDEALLIDSEMDTDALREELLSVLLTLSSDV